MTATFTNMTEQEIRLTKILCGLPVEPKTTTLAPTKVA